jgi:hypothetical protein
MAATAAWLAARSASWPRHQMPSAIAANFRPNRTDDSIAPCPVDSGAVLPDRFEEFIESFAHLAIPSNITPESGALYGRRWGRPSPRRGAPGAARAPTSAFGRRWGAQPPPWLTSHMSQTHLAFCHYKRASFQYEDDTKSLCPLTQSQNEYCVECFACRRWSSGCLAMKLRLRVAVTEPRPTRRA